MDGFCSAKNVDRIYYYLAAHVAKGDLQAIKQDWLSLSEEERPMGYEVILQTILMVGWPRVINALIAVREVDATVPTEFAEEVEMSQAEFRRRGEETISIIYSTQYEKLRARMSQLHPALDRWIIDFAYGQVLGRPGLSPTQRELATVAALIGLSCPPQLMSHIRGSINVGATAEEVVEVLNLTTELHGPATQAEVNKVWEQYNQRRTKS